MVKAVFSPLFLLSTKYFSCSLDDGVAVAVEILHGQGNADVGCHAILCTLFVAVKHRAGRETDAPTVGEFAGEGQACSATGAVTHDRDVGTTAHILHKFVGSRVDLSVGEHHDGFLPA